MPVNAPVATAQPASLPIEVLIAIAKDPAEFEAQVAKWRAVYDDAVASRAAADAELVALAERKKEIDLAMDALAQSEARFDEWQRRRGAELGDIDARLSEREQAVRYAEDRVAKKEVELASRDTAMTLRENAATTKEMMLIEAEKQIAAEREMMRQARELLRAAVAQAEDASNRKIKELYGDVRAALAVAGV